MIFQQEIILDPFPRGFHIITNDPNVKAIFINIFGGIVQCDMIAKGVIEAIKNLSLSVPVVMRLEGSNADKAQTVIEESGFGDQLVMMEGLANAAQKVVELGK